jgi:hypothetical protein
MYTEVQLMSKAVMNWSLLCFSSNLQEKSCAVV